MEFHHIDIQGTIKHTINHEAYTLVDNMVKVIVYWVLDIIISAQILLIAPLSNVTAQSECSRVDGIEELSYS